MRNPARCYQGADMTTFTKRISLVGITNNYHHFGALVMFFTNS